MFDSEMSNDRLGFSKYGEQHKRILNLTMIIGAVTLVVCIAAFIFGYILELKDNQNTTSSMTLEEQAYLKSQDSGDNYDDLMSQNASNVKTPILGEVFSDRSKVPDSFAKIQMGLRIMPS